MNRSMLNIFFIGLLVCAAPVLGQSGVTVSIDEIVMNDHVSGKVSGLTENGTSDSKVVVYVKTNKWYVHPFAQGGVGKSFAIIKSDGSWTIETVRRDFAASAIAALLVQKDSRLPSQVTNVRTIPNRGVVVKELEGTEDYGKL